MSDYGVVLFHTTSSAFRAEKVLAAEGIGSKLIPTPRQFSSDCGISARFDWEKQEDVARILDAAGVEVAGIHRMS